jgi:hypothetical protein
VPHEGVDHAKTQALQREPQTKDDVVCARYPQGAVGLENALDHIELPDLDSRPFRSPSDE